MFAREQLRISRLLTAHLEAFGAMRVGRSGVKFDRLGKTVSGQPLFDVDEETAEEIRATFILDLALLRSYGRGAQGLSPVQKQLLLALWKVQALLAQPFRYRSQCHLRCTRTDLSTDSGPTGAFLPPLQVQAHIQACAFRADPVTRVYYPASELFKVAKDGDENGEASGGKPPGDAGGDLFEEA